MHEIESRCTTYVGPKEVREKDNLFPDSHRNAPRKWYLNGLRHERREEFVYHECGTSNKCPIVRSKKTIHHVNGTSEKHEQRNHAEICTT